MSTASKRAYLKVLAGGGGGYIYETYKDVSRRPRRAYYGTVF